MPIFAYKYIDESGTRHNAFQEGKTEREVAQQLDSMGLAVLSVKRIHSPGSHKKSAPATKGKVTRRELIEFCIYLGSLCEAGLPIISALHDFAAEAKNPFLQHVIETIKHGVENGQTLSDGMQQFPKVFTKEFVHLIQAGEQTGTLPNSLTELRLHLEWLERIGSDIKQATTYPMVVSIALGLFILLLFSTVVPKIGALLISMNLKLPLITQVVLKISEIAVKTWWMLLLAAFLFTFGIRYLINRFDAVAELVDKIKLNVPIFGLLVQMIVQARFTKNFAVFQRAGISILDNLSLCKGIIGNRIYSNALQRTIQDVRDGGTLSVSMKESGLFSGLIIKMITIGEASGTLEKSLTFASAYFDEEVPRRIKRVFAIFEPLIIVALVLIVGAVALAIFLPILSISRGFK